MLPVIQASFSHPHSGLLVLGRILPPPILSAVARAFGCYGKFHFLLLWLPVAACGSLCKRKDILLILVINPLGISETGGKIVRKV